MNVLKLLVVLCATFVVSIGVDMKCYFETTSGTYVHGNYYEANGSGSLVITAPEQVVTSVNGQSSSYHHSQNVYI